MAEPNKAAAAAATAPAYRKPAVGDIVHFYDEQRAVNYSKQGGGPYAAMVTFRDVGGLSLQIFAPHGGFHAERVRHKSELDPKDAGKKKWWQWPRD